MILVHATSVEIDGQGVLIRGPSGSGKSDLALRLMDGGAQLIADDQTELSRQGSRVVARAPETIAGLLEVRGLGIVRVTHRSWAPLALVVDLTSDERIERLPEPSYAEYLGLTLPRMELDPFRASASAKVRLAVHSAKRDIMPS
ncbi:serine/threonine protein kinase [Paramagnetospirillum marisnigri]|uniref:Serine/threonine protein kinase n=1 Tax=Paramagnetospirillum marisnigri TaxID=1285242 RepID=A0A178MNX9_9PROT|nr:serine/threonine protein kinase [Paramagnetospirillum marisnigri]OAN50263.1 serine/threonine protein kinase [Paramagnetospirillum marisnigri]